MRIIFIYLLGGFDLVNDFVHQYSPNLLTISIVLEIRLKIYTKWRSLNKSGNRNSDFATMDASSPSNFELYKKEVNPEAPTKSY